MVHSVYYTQRIHRLRTVSENTTLSLVEAAWRPLMPLRHTYLSYYSLKYTKHSRLIIE